MRIVMATHPDHRDAPEIVRRYLRIGASPRGAQAMVVAAKVRALLDGRYAVSAQDLRALAKPALRHRILRNFEGEAEGVSTDTIIDTLLRGLKEVG